MQYVAGTTDLKNRIIYDIHENTTEEPKESSSLHLEQDTPQDQFLALLLRQNTLDEGLWLKNIPAQAMPPLDKKTLINIVNLLSKFIVAEINSPYKGEFLLMELLIDFGYQTPVIKSEFVGGIVFWLLKDHYLNVFLTALGIENTDLIPELIKAWQAMPNDIDVRIHVPYSSIEHLKNCEKIIDQFIARKIGERALQENCDAAVNYSFLAQTVQDCCYDKRHTQYDESNHYSTITLKDIEILIVEEKGLSIESLFIRDALRSQY